MKDIVTVVAVLGLIIVGFFAATKDTEAPQINVPLGAIAGNNVTSKLTTKAGFSQAGVLTIASSSATRTLKNADIENVATIQIRQSSTTATFDPALTLTLPASSTWSGLSETGEVQRWIIDNQQTGAATTTTITAGTGVDLDGPTANDDVINGGVSGTLDCWRLPDSNVRCIVEEMVDAG